MTRTNVMSTAKRIRRQMSGGYQQQQEVLTVAIDDNDTTLQFGGTLPLALVAGCTLGIDTELLYVRSVNTSAFTATVTRGYADSEAAAHVISSMVDINPRFSLLSIVEAMRAEIATWAPRLFWVDAASATVDPTVAMYELPAKWADVVHILTVLQQDGLDEEISWPQVDHKVVRGTRRSFTDAESSGIYLRFTEAIREEAIHITVALPFDPEDLPTTGDLVDDYNLTDGLVDLLEMGTKLRLTRDEQIAKQQRHMQDDSRRAEETPIGTLVPLGQVLLATYTKRFNDEVLKLRQRYPYRQS